VAERSELRSVAAAEGGSPQIIIYQVKYLKRGARPKPVNYNEINRCRRLEFRWC
jgi:hypothetical protein